MDSVICFDILDIQTFVTWHKGTKNSFFVNNLCKRLVKTWDNKLFLAHEMIYLLPTNIYILTKALPVIYLLRSPFGFE